MIYTYTSSGNYKIGFDYLTTSLPSDVDNVYITCTSVNDPRTDLYCDRHMTCYKKYDTFRTSINGNGSNLYCDIIIHEKNDTIPQTRPETYFNPCNHVVFTTTRYKTYLFFFLFTFTYCVNNL